MKRNNYSRMILWSLFISAGAFAQMPVPTAEQEAKFEASLFATADQLQAASAAAEFLKLIYGVADKSIKFDAPVLQGDRFTVKAVIPGRNCNMALTRNATANKFGWVVQEYTCPKAG
jgi:hypothetical protein